MTREEAVKILRGAIKHPNSKDGYMGQALTMAIEALSQPKTQLSEEDITKDTTSDLINRQDAIDAFKNITLLCGTDGLGRPVQYEDLLAQIIGTLIVLPSAQQWIPVTDCLPAEYDTEYYWVTIYGKTELAWCIDPANNKWSVYNPEGLPYDSCDVIAWYPMPEPYKGEQE